MVRFTGTEGLSKLYQFDLTLLSEKTSIDFKKALSGTATFTIKRQEGGDLTWHGILRDFQQLQRSDKHVFYRALLVPKAWELTQTMHNQIFLNMDMPEFLQQCLTDAGLSQGLDFQVNTTGSYPKREYVCQYNETHFNFASRWMERNGFYFFFDQSGSQEKVVITDSLNVHTPNPGGDTLKYAEPTGLDAGLTGQAAKNFYCDQRRLPKEVLLKDYNYRTPSLTIQAKELVSESGTGTVYMHGGHLLTPTEAASEAKIRTEEFKCREQLFFGESNAPFLQPGYTFTLQDHYRSDFNQSYLLIEVKHEGAQESWLTAGLEATGVGDKLFYRNSFAAIPASVQFRPEVKTPKPKIEGPLSAVIDAEESGQYAELDDQGRYKVIMPFDLSGRKDGQASTWLRMIQPYAGSGHGMHFPLHKGTEVAVIHYEGDPDRPVIAGAVPNPETQSMVTSANQTMSNITTSGGNQIHIQDQDGSQRILLNSTAKGNFIRIGAHNDPAVDWGDVGDTIKEMATDGINLTTPQWFNVKAEFANQIVLADNTQTTIGFYSCNYIGGALTFYIGPAATFHVGPQKDYTLTRNRGHFHLEEAGAETTRTLGALAEQVMDHTQTLGEHTQTIAEHTQTIGEHTETIAEHTETIAEHTENIGEIDRWAGSIEETIGEIDQFAAQVNQTLADHTQTIGEHTQTLAEHTQTIGELEQNAGDINILSVTVNNITTDNVFIAATFNVV
ncbi:MAG: type VI secretion system tip protein VgrG [Desulfovibrio sp.]|nr:type VI secretion system tip protein VgrG [Desulfovibrio sp.]